MATYEIGGIFNVLQSCKSKPVHQEGKDEVSEKVNLTDLFTVTNVVEEEHSDCEASTDDDLDDDKESENNNEENEEEDEDDDENDDIDDADDKDGSEDDIEGEIGPDEIDEDVEMSEVDKSSEVKVKTSKKEAAKKKHVLTQKDSNVHEATADKLEKVEKKDVIAKKDVDADSEDKDLKKKVKQEESPERLERTLFVGNVSINVTKKALKKIFIEFGEIETLRFRSFIGADLKVPKKVAVIKKEFHSECKSLHAYVVYKNKESIGKALKCNGMVLEGLHLRVDTAVPQKKQTNQNSVFVGNLPFNIPDEDVYEHFKKCGTIDYVRIIRDKPTGVGKGFGYVAFTNRDGFIFGLKLNGTKLNGREIRVSRCENTNRFNGVRKGSGGDSGGFLNKQNRKNNQQPQFQGLKASTSMKDRIKGRKFVQQKQKRTKPNNALRRIKNKSNNTSDSSIGSKKKSKSADKQNQKMKKRKM